MMLINKLKICLVAFVSVLSMSQIIGQTQDDSHVIKAIGTVDATDNSVKLKWSPSDLHTLELALEFGYKISRAYKLDASGNTTPPLEMVNSAISLEEAYMPATEAELQTLSSQGNDWTDFASSLIYDNTLVTPPASPNLRDAVEGKRANESKHFFMLVLAEKGFDVATALGLAYTDTNVDPTRDPVYFISIAENTATPMDWDNITYANILDDNTLQGTSWGGRPGATGGPGDDQKLLNGENGYLTFSTDKLGKEMIGFSEENETDITKQYTSIDYEIFLTDNGNWQYTVPSAKRRTVGPYYAGDQFKVEIDWDRGVVIFSRLGHEVIEKPLEGQANIEQLIVDVTMSGPTSKIENLKLHKPNAKFTQHPIRWSNLNFAEIIEDNTLKGTAWSGKPGATGGDSPDQKLLKGENGYLTFTNDGVGNERVGFSKVNGTDPTRSLWTVENYVALGPNGIWSYKTPSVHTTPVGPYNAGDQFKVEVEWDKGTITFSRIGHEEIVKPISGQSNTEEYIIDIGMSGTNAKIENLKFFKANSGETQKGIVTISGDNATQPAVTLFSGYGGDKVANLSWSVEQTKQIYTYYNIERSSGGGPFVVMNDQPFAFLSDDESDMVSYTDELANNDTEYQYRIVGISPFGGFGPASEVITVKGVHPRFDLSIPIDRFEPYEDGSLVVRWNFTNSEKPLIKHFHLYASETVDGPFVKISTTPMPNWRKWFRRVSAPGDAYYKLEITDINDNTYLSPAALGQPKDKTPPAAPVGLAGKIRSNGQVELSWSANTESDLSGYQVLYSNSLDGPYAQITSTQLKTTEYVTTIDPNVEIEQIYYRVFAVDHRYNASPYSEALILDRPDLVGPSNPVISQLMGREEGIRVSWRLSEDEDVVRHVLQRKLTIANAWEDVVVITDPSAFPPLALVPYEMTASHYIDDEELTLLPYHYRLVAEDDAGNMTSSGPKEVQPYDDGIRGAVLGLTAISTQGGGLQAGSGGTFNGGSISDGNTLYEGYSPVILNWEYETEYFNTLLEFKVYKTSTKHPLSPAQLADIDNLDIDPFVIAATIPGRESKCDNAQIGLPEFSGHCFIDDNPNEGYQNIYYKVIAWHRDGGFSTWSEVVHFNSN